MATSSVVVWEWQNEYGQWRPYSPEICKYLESNKQSNSNLPLGVVDHRLSSYTVELNTSTQTRLGTGTQRPVRRTLLSSMSALGQGCIWQWEGDQPGTWNDFDVEQSEYIETCFRTNSRSQVDFQKKFRLPYIIDLAAQTQTRTHTGRVRTIRRWFLTSQYPTEVQQLSSGVKTRSMSPRPGHSASKQFKSTATATLTGASNSTTFMTSTAPSTHLNTHHVYSRTHNSVPVSYTNGIGSSASLGVSSTSGTLPQVNSSVQIALPQVNSSVQSALPQVNSSVQSVLPGPLTRSRVFMHSQTFGAGAGAFNSVGGPHLQTGSSQLQHIGGPHSYQHPSLSSTGPAGAPFQLGSAGSSFSGLFGGAMPTFMTRNHQSTYTAQFSSAGVSLIRPTVSSSGGGFQQALSLPYSGKIPNYTESSQSHTKSAEEILSCYVTELGACPQNEDCCICFEKLAEASGHGKGTSEDHVVYQLERCSHMYHKLCLLALYESGQKKGSLQCPACKTIYGEMTGNCPDGEMEYRLINRALPGNEGAKTIEIVYNVFEGVQGANHPNPGHPFYLQGFPRVGYLPDCDKGRKVLQLLIVAWKRRLTFTIGRSATTNRDNCVTWNEIHHKSECQGNHNGHGFPDPKYLDNVLGELAVHGVTEKDLGTVGGPGRGLGV